MAKKKAATSTSRRPTRKAARRAPSRPPGITVKMYRMLLGDCFLLTLPSQGARPFYLMIDCGVILGTPDASEKMDDVVKDIIKTTGGEVDLLVVTHEHWDHLSGFIQAKDLFVPGDEGRKKGKLRIEKMWLAWTEDPDDDLANLLRGHRRQTEHALRMASRRLRAVEQDVGDIEARASRFGAAGAEHEEAAPQPVWERIDSLLDFFGADEGFGARGTKDGLENAKKFSSAPPRYCRPSDDPIEIDEVPGMRFYIIGPPQDEKLIKRSRPSRRHPEVYEHSFSDHAFLAALEQGMAASAGSDDWAEASQPFDKTFRIPLRAAQETPFFQERYFSDLDSESRGQNWRRIDADWLRAAAQLALKLDDDTNNTSLAIAMEIKSTGKVLLFPGDAQVGNWLSWEDVSWEVDGEKVTAHDLLKRTVLYKVGHHGSHNATLREKGLELMQDPDLVAMVPVDHEMAKKKGWGKIPFNPLLDRLHEKAKGRVIRGDDKKGPKERKRPEGVKAAIWKQFQKRTEQTELYVEYQLGG